MAKDCIKFFRSYLLCVCIGLVVPCVLIVTLSGTVVPALNVSDLTAKADVIVVGRIIRTQQSGATTLDYGQPIEARVISAELQSARILKGSPNGNLLFIRFLQPELPIGYSGVPINRYRIFFLKNGSDTVYELVSPYYPTVIATRSSPPTSGDELARVINEIGSVLRDTATSSEDRLEAIHTLEGVHNPDADTNLVQVLKDKDELVRLSAAATLLEHNDISGIGLVEQALLHPSPAIPQYVRHNLTFSVGQGVRNSKAVPYLVQLLRAGDVETRRAAASALRNIGSDAAIDGLTRALNDNDFEVRYFGVIGLAEITGQSEWRPLEDEFKSNEQRYLSHWLQWARTNTTDR